MEKKNKQIIPNCDDLSLTEYFSHLPKATRIPVIISAPKEELVEEIALLCARRWVYGYTKPNPVEKQKIAVLLESSVEVLFPIKPKEKS